MNFNKKNKILLLGFAFTLYICYTFAISNTIDLYKQYKNQKMKSESSINNPELLSQLKQKERQLDLLLRKYNIVEGVSFQNDLLKELNLFCKKNDLKITKFLEPHFIEQEDIKTNNYTFSVEGSYNNVVLLIHLFENNPKFGNVKSVSFVKNRNYKTNQDYLITDIILEKTENVFEK